ncbi:capsular biosynthesis protein [Pseudorhodobacter turbinis]|uniref:Capsular biosynthesis protein n=1 Tax=Pseudorhodobacter turbinis TaxID=2500533 RepID=A0A4P8EF81_9RHOB|nr:capsular biosynthesis protein [Pseudorhodobacter turbinis]QCO55508.1 capsular biosynthesis protein [Pseudorhodobacter turbinis]
MKIVIDLDQTITAPKPGETYENASCNTAVVAKLKEYQQQGFTIAIHTARNMRTHSGNLGKINTDTLPLIIRWLDKNQVPYDEIFVGKPWCEDGGFYVDDKSIRPDEFAKLSLKEIYELIGETSPQ